MYVDVKGIVSSGHPTCILPLATCLPAVPMATPKEVQALTLEIIIFRPKNLHDGLHLQIPSGKNALLEIAMNRLRKLRI